jgi:hypothetical protein
MKIKIKKSSSIVRANHCGLSLPVSQKAIIAVIKAPIPLPFPFWGSKLQPAS